MLTHTHYRPDFVYSTSVIDPYPVGEGPVNIARKTVVPFVRAVYGQTPNPALDGYLGGYGGLGGQGPLPMRPPVGARGARARIAANSAFGVQSQVDNIVQTLQRPIPQYRPEQAAMAMNRAFSRGSIWDQIRAKQRLMRIRGMTASPLLSKFLARGY
jgi:hypothetical protein